MGVLCGKPLVLHEQNSVAGMANKVLAGVADRVFTAFPTCSRRPSGWEPAAHCVHAPGGTGRAFCGPHRPAAAAGGGRQPGRPGAQRDRAPGAGLIPPEQRPVVIHQSGATQIDALRANYEAAGVQAELTPFIEDTASAFAHADIIVCRAGASTVTEIAAVGAAAIFVPFPSAVDDHQTTNAQFLVGAGGGWLVQQSDLTPEGLAKMLLNSERPALVEIAEKAKNMQKSTPPAKWWPPARSWHETRHSSHPLVGLGGGHERHCRSAVQPGLPHFGLGPGRQRHAAPPAGPGHQDLPGPRRSEHRWADAVVTSTAVTADNPRCWRHAPRRFPWCPAPSCWPS